MHMTKEELGAFWAAHPKVAKRGTVLIDLCGNAIGKRLTVAQVLPWYPGERYVDIQGEMSTEGFRSFLEDVLACECRCDL